MAPVVVPHQHQNKFPDFVPTARISDILDSKWLDEIPSRILTLIHLSPDNPVARPYCNIYWPNVNRNAITYYDGRDWATKHIDTWFLGFWGWIFRCWKAIPDRNLDQETEFMVIFSNRDTDKRWTSAKRLTVNALLASGVRKDIKKLHGFR